VKVRSRHDRAREAAAAWQSSPGARQVISHALSIATDRGRDARPVDLLAALAEGEGPIGALFKENADGLHLARPMGNWRGGHTGYLAGQVIGAAGRFASRRSEAMAPSHLLVAVLDQSDNEVTEALTKAKVHVEGLRGGALGLMGAAPDLPPIPLPPLCPAGTGGRPPLEISQLDTSAWARLQWRQERLPLDRLKRRWQAHGLWDLERRAAGRAADRFGVDVDQRYSLLKHHMAKVEELAREARPDLLGDRGLRAGLGSGPVGRFAMRCHRRKWTRRLAGWATWAGNRREAGRNKYFWLTTFRYYRGGPRPTKRPGP